MTWNAAAFPNHLILIHLVFAIFLVLATLVFTIGMQQLKVAVFRGASIMCARSAPNDGVVHIKRAGIGVFIIRILQGRVRILIYVQLLASLVL